MQDSRLQLLRGSPLEKADSQDRETVPRPHFNWKTRILIPGIVAGGFVCLLGLSAYQELAPAISVHASPAILKVVEGNVLGSVTVQAAGWVEADPYKSYVTALTDGVVSDVLVLEGESIAQGQVVARLVNDDARLAVERAEGKVGELESLLAVEKAERKAAQTEWENPVERKRAIEVGKAQLAEAKATLEQITAEISVEESNLENAKSQYERATGLHNSGAVSEQEFVRLRSQFKAQVSRISALRMRFAAVTELVARHDADLKASKEHMELRTEERRRLDRARAATLQAEAALAQARTALAEARLRLERTEIRSPMAGVVMGRHTEPGSKVVVLSDNPNSAKVLSLSDPKRLQVRVDVPLADAAKISVGQQAEVTVEVLPDRAFGGTVTRVLHEANIQKNTLEAKVSLQETDPRLRPEMLARVRFLAKVEPTAEDSGQRLFVPENALRGAGRDSKAWVLTDFDGDRAIAVSRSIRLGTAKVDGWVNVLDGLHPGDLVITNPPSDLADGRRVRVLGLDS